MPTSGPSVTSPPQNTQGRLGYPKFKSGLSYDDARQKVVKKEQIESEARGIVQTSVNNNVGVFPSTGLWFPARCRWK